MKLITSVADVPGPGSPELEALKALGVPTRGGFLVGFAAGKAAAKLPKGARVVRVVVVAEPGKVGLGEGEPHGRSEGPASPDSDPTASKPEGA